jgi:RNA polymerase sigma-70 factor (ECF subfamily)
MYYEGYSIKEISEIIKIKPATIGTRLKRGREILKNILGDDYFAE